MSDLFNGFLPLGPEKAAAVQTALTQIAKEVEDKNPHAESDAKEAAALKKAYDALDLLINAPGPVDFVVKDLVIPHLPAFFRWVTEELHKLGVFGPHKKA
jgi:hypothetical protein